MLLVKEKSDGWWALPGGGVDYGETVEKSLVREIVEELGVPAEEISLDLQIAYYNIGKIVNAVPRMNLFFKASMPAAELRKTSHIEEWAWFGKKEFLSVSLHASYSKAELAEVIF